MNPTEVAGNPILLPTYAVILRELFAFAGNATGKGLTSQPLRGGTNKKSREKNRVLPKVPGINERAWLGYHVAQFQIKADFSFLINLSDPPTRKKLGNLCMARVTTYALKLSDLIRSEEDVIPLIHSNA